jgi:hypothetical protein
MDLGVCTLERRVRKSGGGAGLAAGEHRFGQADPRERDLLIWGTAEGFDGPYTSGASDIGTAVIYPVVFAAQLALSYYAGPSRYSADYYLEKKVSWWWRVAETRRPAPVEAPVPVGIIPAQATPATAPDSAAHGKLPRTA